MESGFAKQEFENIYRIYYKRMFGLCMTYVKDKTVAEDLVQDSFVVILTKINTLKDKTKLESWMFSIVRNTCLSYINKKKLFNTITLNEQDKTSELNNETEDEFIENISYERLIQMVENLPEGYKKVFKMSILENKTHNEIAQLLNMNPHTSQSQLYRARKLLQKTIRKTLLPIVLIVFVVLIYNNKHFIANKQVTENITATKIYKNKHSVNIHKETENKNKTRLKENKVLWQATKAAVDNNGENKIGYEDNISDIDNKISNNEELLTLNEDTVFEKSENIPLYNDEKGKDDIVSGYDYLQETKQQDNWSVKIDVTSLFVNNLTTNGNYVADYGILNGYNANNGIDISGLYVENVKYHIPITFDFTVNKRLGNGFSIDGGLSYSILKTDFNVKDGGKGNYNIQYIGLNAQFLYHYIQIKLLNAYIGLGGMFEVPVYYKAELLFNNTKKILDIKPKTQFSVAISLGLSAKITEQINVFVQPSVNYFFDNGDKFDTYRKQNKLSLSVPIGIRIKL